MVDTEDSKSSAREGVRVRIPLRVQENFKPSPDIPRHNDNGRRAHVVANMSISGTYLEIYLGSNSNLICAFRNWLSFYQNVTTL